MADVTEIVIVLDRSGSMVSIMEDTIGGVNTFLKQQKEAPGDANFTLVQFDDQYEVVHDGVPIGDVQDLSTETFVPRGATALLDAIGKTINRIKSRTALLTPDSVVFAIVTDGQENRSREFNHSAVMELIQAQEAQGWQFVYLGANQDAIKEAAKFGVRSATACCYTANSVAVDNAWTSLSSNVANYRGKVKTCRAGGMSMKDAAASLNWTEQDRQQNVMTDSTTAKEDTDAAE